MVTKTEQTATVRTPIRVLAAVMLVPFLTFTLMSMADLFSGKRDGIDGMFVFSVLAVLFFSRVAVFGKSIVK